MSESGCKQYSWFKSWLVTTLFCAAISVTTQSIWGGPLFTSAMISFGFGYSAVFSSFVLIKLFPDTSRLLEIAISMVFASNRRDTQCALLVEWLLWRRYI